MPPAARITDMHVCPMVTGIVPHVGGPILPPGCPTVLIGSLPAARVTDMATCVGPPDVIIMGSPTVLIGNLMAARIGDPTAHGGVIVLGCPTVIIGEAGVPSPSAASGQAVPPSPTPPPTTSVSSEGDGAAAAAAEALLKSAKSAESSTTRTLKAIAGANGAEMRGLENRFKTEESLARKIASDSEHLNVPTDVAARNIGDALRYTLILDAKHYADGTNSILDDLQAKGHKVLKVKNTWKDGSAYKGVNAVIKTPEGQKYEIQFHTEESFKMKQANHKLYERVRAADTSPAERRRLMAIMQRNSARLQPPPGVEKIKDRG